MGSPTKLDRVPRTGSRFSAWFGRTMLSVMGWKIIGEFPSHCKMVIAVAPHTSNWDFFIGLFTKFALRLRLHFFGKHSIFVWPVRNLLIGLGGIPVQRSKTHGFVTQLVSRFQQSESLLLALAPEGTRSKVVNWKSGFLHIAHQANVRLLLVGLDYQTKSVVIGEARFVSDDIEKEMQQVRAFFAQFKGKHPKNA